jgi:hypothetical protein
LVLIVLWTDNSFIIGPKKAVEKTKKDLMERFGCKDCGDIKEYVRCKKERTKNSFKFTQLVLMQRYNDKFELSEKSYKTPAPAGLVLVTGKKEEAQSPAMQKKYCSGTGKAMHAMHYSKPEMYKAVQDLYHHIHEATWDHYKVMLHVLKYSLDYGDQGLVIKLNRKWDGSCSHEFVISGCSDLDYAKEANNRRSVSGHMVYLEGAPAMFKSSMERTVSLSTTEAETYASVTCVQHMLYMRSVLESLGLRVKLPMILEMDNQGAVYLAKNWSIEGRTRHIDVQLVFLRELKEAGVLVMKWILGAVDKADIFTKNLDGPAFQQSTRVFTVGTQDKGV